MSFDLLAPHYTWMERVLAGPRLQRARTRWLEEIAGSERILIAGVGHGHFLRTCAHRFPNAEIVSVDASGPMLARARRGHAGNRRLQFVQAALPDWQPSAHSFDAIVTNFFLDCFAPTELSAVIDVLAKAARPSAHWLLADFTVPRAGWRRHRARAIQTAMYAFFRPVAGVKAHRVTPPDPLLRAAGFEMMARSEYEWGLLHADHWRRV